MPGKLGKLKSPLCGSCMMGHIVGFPYDGERELIQEWYGVRVGRRWRKLWIMIPLELDVVNFEG